MRVNCRPGTQHNVPEKARSRPLYPDTSALSMRPPCLHYRCSKLRQKPWISIRNHWAVWTAQLWVWYKWIPARQLLSATGFQALLPWFWFPHPDRRKTRLQENLEERKNIVQNVFFKKCGISESKKPQQIKTAFKTHVTSEKFFVTIIVTSSFSPLMMNAENSKAVRTLRRIGGRGLPGV